VKQFSPAFERNRDPILEVLREVLKKPGLVLEVASGSGQHVAYFSKRLPHLIWQPSETRDKLASIEAYRGETEGGKICPALELDLLRDQWPLHEADHLVCINTIHIAPWRAAENLFSGGARILAPGGIFLVYGPYRYRHQPLERSNLEFDRALRMRDPSSGLRYFEDVQRLARMNGLRLMEDRAMPANNRCIWWRRAVDQSSSAEGATSEPRNS
jgi:SAM-dependent methyltransferase